MKFQALLGGGLIVAAIVAASLTLDGQTVPSKKIAGGSEACTYHAGPIDFDLISQGGDAGQRIVRAILALDRKCEYVTLAYPDGTREIMKLGKDGRKPGEKGPPSIPVF